MSIGSIGIHVSPEVKIEFFEQEDGSRIQARVSSIEDPVEVVLPETQNSCVLGFSSLATKVEFFLLNRQLKPVYLTEPKQVHFKPCFAGGASWEEVNKISVPNNLLDSNWICRSNGTISYVFINTVKTWDPVNDTWTVASYPTTRITALAEDIHGALVVGDEKGQLHLSGKIYFTGIAKAIEEIILTTPHHFLIKFSNVRSKKAILFDVELLYANNSKNREFDKKDPHDFYSEQAAITDGHGASESKEANPLHLKPGSSSSLYMQALIELKGEVFVVGNGSVVSLNENTMIVQQYNSQEKKYKECEHNLKEIFQIRVVSNTTLLILHKRAKSLTFWNLETNDKCLLQNPTLWQNCSIKKAFLLDHETLVMQFGYCAYSIKENSFHDLKVNRWNTINDMILLSNGSLIYATNCSGSGIYVIQKDTTLSFEMKTGDRKIESFKELVDGSVAVRFFDSIMILKPCFKELENINYQKLADLYEKEDKKVFGVYLSGLEAAAKCHNPYQARRFYEKARKLQPQNEEPIQSFLFYLKNSPYEKLKRQLFLDLHALPQNKEHILPLKEKYKKRLLIGEANFTFTEAFLSKHEKSHPGLGKSITATELLAPVDEDVVDRIASLQKKGVTILFGVDAQTIHRLFKGRRFERIQWNCPFGNPDKVSREAFLKVVPVFFQSCSSLQLAGDRVHVTLVQKDPDVPSEYWKKRQKENPIVLASVSSNYRLIRKRRFEKDRYPQYLHVMTGTSIPYSAGGKEREFVFEKVAEEASELPFPERAIALRDPAQKEYKISTDEKDNPLPKDYYFECSTDEDSSDGYESD